MRRVEMYHKKLFFCVKVFPAMVASVVRCGSADGDIEGMEEVCFCVDRFTA
jgi:hypothetical protein